MSRTSTITIITSAQMAMSSCQRARHGATCSKGWVRWG
jgi:hypothetical protein